MIRRLESLSRLPYVALTFLSIGASAAVVDTVGRPSVDRGGRSALSIPIFVAPGTGAMSPAISLEYNSRFSDGRLFEPVKTVQSVSEGFAGVGWSLVGLPSIVRCAKTVASDQITLGVMGAQSDRFCLNGSKLIIKDLGESYYGAAGAQHRTESESFTRVVPYGWDVDGGPLYFKAWLKTGEVLEFGNSTDSRFRLQGPAGATWIREWAVNKVSDRFENYYSVSYAANTVTGEFVPSRIDYTGNATAGTLPYNSIRFVYETRPDVSSFNVGPAQVWRQQRLTKIQSYVDEALVMEKRFAYATSPTSGKSRITSVSECAASGACLAPLNVTYTDGGGGISAPGSTVQQTGNLVSTSTSIASLLPGDFNGDGNQDLFIVDAAGNAKACYGPTFTQCTGNWPLNGAVPIVLDFNGDGFSDIALQGTGGGGISLCPGPGIATCTAVTALFLQARYKISAGDVFGKGKDSLVFWSRLTSYSTTICDAASLFAGATSATACSQRSAYPKGDFGLAKGDFNGDGKTDFALVSSTGYYLCNDFGNISGCFNSSYAGFSNSKYAVGDFNGDGIDDLISLTDTAILYCFGPAMGQASICSPLPNSSGNWIGADIVSGDFNGDGAQDLMVIGGGMTLFCPGPGISAGYNCISVLASGSGQDLHVVMDYDGNGTQDLVTAGTTFAKLSAGGAALPDLLQTVTNSAFGTITSFQYAPLTNGTYYTKGTGAAFPLQDTRKPATVVSRLSVPNGIGGTNMIDYVYRYARNGVDGRGFAGFATTIVTDQASGKVRTTVRRQVFPFIGSAESVYTSIVGGTTVASYTRTFDSMTSFETRSFPVMTTAVEVVEGLDGAWKSQKTTYEYDSYGNVLCTTTYDDTVTSVYKSKLCSTYASSDATWLLGQLTAQTNSYKNTAGNLVVQQDSFTPLNGTLETQSAIREPGSSTLRVDVVNTFDSFGNITSSSTAGINTPLRVSNSIFDTRGQFETSTTNALGHQTILQYDLRFGIPTTVTDPNGVSSTTSYDEFGRLASESQQGGAAASYGYEVCCSGFPTTPNLAYRLSKTVSGLSNSSYSYFDALGRPVMTTARNFTGNGWIDSNYTMFDAAGRVIRTYLAFDEADATRPYASISYNPSGGVQSRAAPSGASTTYSYSKASNGEVTSTETRPASQVWKYTSNIRGQLVKIVDPNLRQTTYSYNPLGLWASTNDAGTASSANYDSRGRMTSHSDPNLGLRNFTYDALGQLTQETDPNGQWMYFQYDKLGRVVSRQEPILQATWTWDAAWKGVGQLAQSVVGSTIRSYSYDTFGRNLTQSLVAGGDSFTSAVTYDAVGRQETLIYPTGLVARNVYDGNGRLVEVRNHLTNDLYWKAVAASAAGITDEDFGNGTGVTRVFDANSRRVRQLAVIHDSSGTVLQNHTFDYDAIGNLTARAETTQGLAETMVYDNLNRLTSVTGPAPRTITYAGNGNIASKSDIGSYTYPTSGKVNAVSAAGGTSYSYDANGNMLGVLAAGSTTTYQWTSFNKLSQATVGTQAGFQTYTWTYDADLNRVIMQAPGLRTTYVNAFGRLLVEKRANLTTGLPENRNYVYAGGKAIAVVAQASGASDVLRFMYRDHLGSVALVLDSGGSNGERLSYDAHGKRRSPQGTDDPNAQGLATTRGFTGHEHLESLKLVNMNGRVYDPSLGRFLSPDPMGVDYLNPQSLNRYSYVLNNPLRYSDPSGFYPQGPWQSTEHPDDWGTCAGFLSLYCDPVTPGGGGGDLGDPAGDVEEGEGEEAGGGAPIAGAVQTAEYHIEVSGTPDLQMPIMIAAAPTLPVPPTTRGGS